MPTFWRQHIGVHPEDCNVNYDGNENLESDDLKII
jgi:hypothetical protein